MKRTAFTLLATICLAASATFADDACCAGIASNNMKAKCDATYASLDLTAAQKAKMEKLAADCDKGGCNAESMAKMEKGARKVLTKPQFAAWKAKCSASKQS